MQHRRCTYLSPEVRSWSETRCVVAILARTCCDGSREQVSPQVQDNPKDDRSYEPCDHVCQIVPERSKCDRQKSHHSVDGSVPPPTLPPSFGIGCGQISVGRIINRFPLRQCPPDSPTLREPDLPPLSPSVEDHVETSAPLGRRLSFAHNTPPVSATKIPPVSGRVAALRHSPLIRS